MNVMALLPLLASARFDPGNGAEIIEVDLREAYSRRLSRKFNANLR
jgi:hypothetical protein